MDERVNINILQIVYNAHIPLLTLLLQYWVSTKSCIFFMLICVSMKEDSCALFTYPSYSTATEVVWSS